MTDASSTLGKLLADCDARGVQLTMADGGGLAVDAPQDALTPDLLETLRQHKPELLRLLSQQQQQDPCPGATSEQRELISWFRAHADRIPRTPFYLFDGVEVFGVERFLASLASDIEEGPRGPRWRNGVLFGDLRRLREVFGW